MGVDHCRGWHRGGAEDRSTGWAPSEATTVKDARLQTHDEWGPNALSSRGVLWLDSDRVFWGRATLSAVLISIADTSIADMNETRSCLIHMEIDAVTFHFYARAYDCHTAVLNHFS